MPPQYVYTMERVSKTYEKREILKDITLSFYPGAKIGVLGGNGAGKSTLLRIMAGEDKDFIGDAKPARGMRVGHVPQEPILDPSKNVLENVEVAVEHVKQMLKRFDEVNEALGTEADPDKMEKLLAEQAEIQEKIDACNGWELDRQLEIAMDALRLPPPDADVTKLSGGERRRVKLCQVLMQVPDILLLDEPTNHLDAESVAWLERHLHEFKGMVVAVTHDRYFLDNVAEWILELDRGRSIPWKGNYSSWLEQKQKRLASEEKQRGAFHKKLEHELEWIRMSPKGRLAKNKARIAAYEEMAAREFEMRDEDIDLQIPPGPHLGHRVLEVKNLSKAFGDTVLIENLTFELPRGGIVGVIGPNGAGKTTLFRMILGHEKPDSGELKLGESVVPSYVDQNRETLNADKTVFEEVGGGLDFLEFGKFRLHTRAYLNRFNFKGGDQQKRVGDLSGGERNRLQLAKLLRKGGNLLLLDEPTNDLDVDTLRVLEDALENFPGCVVVISHDRWFLDRLATHILSFEGEGKVRWFEGNFQAYEERRREELGDAYQPHRIKYKKLTT
ncbi:MAG: energy-dependent translational throttle protein EttA [Planctomycetes bacterium]|nr:energy-dependent translational throttle protein EttA [Planctomycetota bacterium]